MVVNADGVMIPDAVSKTNCNLLVFHNIFGWLILTSEGCKSRLPLAELIQLD